MRSRITLAVAGFTMSDLGITVEDNQLVVRGKQTDDAQRVYLHRGIAARQFQRSFVLAEGIEVSGAMLDNGLLHIDLVRPEVESRVRTVEIKSGSTMRPSALRSVETRNRAGVRDTAGKGEMNKIEGIRHMSAHELALFGMQDIAYVKRAARQ